MKDWHCERLHQTDYRLSGPKCTTLAGNVVSAIPVFGCLFRSLIYFAEDKADRPATDKEILEMYKRCVSLDIMGDTCYVKSHNRVGDVALEVLGIRSKKMYYIAIDGTPNGKEVNVLRHEYNGQADLRIQQIAVRGASSHFRPIELSGAIEFDPYPQLPVTDVLSYRMYTIR